MKSHYAILPAAALAFTLLPAAAQQQPDAGRVLQENTQTLPRPAEAASTPIEFGRPAGAALAGGMQVMVRNITISGNTRIPESQLLQALGAATGKSYDFAGLEMLAARLTAYY